MAWRAEVAPAGGSFGESLGKLDDCCRRWSAVSGAVHGLDGEFYRTAGSCSQPAQVDFDALTGWSGHGDQLARQVPTVDGCQEPERSGWAGIARGDPGDESLAGRHEFALGLDLQIRWVPGWPPIVGPQLDREVGSARGSGRGCRQIDWERVER